MPYTGLIATLAVALVACGGAQQGAAEAPEGDEIACEGKNQGDACTEPDGDAGTCVPDEDPPHRLECENDAKP